MEITKRLISNNIGSFIAVLLLFGVGWKYLDEQRIEAFKTKEEAIKLKAEVDSREAYLTKGEAEFLKRKSNLEFEAVTKKEQLDKLSSALAQKEQSVSIDTELQRLSSKYLDDSSDVNISQTCGDDEEHNERVRTAHATLSLIESLAKQYNKPAFLLFVKQQRQGIYSWQAKCKPEPA